MPIISVVLITAIAILILIDGSKYLVENKIYWARIKEGVAPKDLVATLRVLNRASIVSYIVIASIIFIMFLGIYISINM